jgi:hypothetical protein
MLTGAMLTALIQAVRDGKYMLAATAILMTMLCVLN